MKNILKVERLQQIYIQLTELLRQAPLFISYDDGDKYQNMLVENLEVQLQEILSLEAQQIGFSVCVYTHNSEPQCNIHCFMPIYETLCPKLIHYGDPEDVLFDINLYMKDKSILFMNEANIWENQQNIQQFCTLITSLKTDFLSFDTCKQYLYYANGALLYENIIHYLKKRNIEYFLRSSINKIDLCLYNHDWWLIIDYGKFTFGYGGGSLWFSTDRLEELDKLSPLGFQRTYDKAYGGDILSSTCKDNDLIDDEEIEPLTRDITERIEKIRKLI